jgi:capsule assembly protein Wzi
MYERIEAVSAFFPVRGLHLGQRPLSRRELQRVVGQLTRAVDSSAVDPQVRHRREEWARGELALVRAEFQRTGRQLPHAGMSAFADWRLDAMMSNAKSERLESNGLGEIDAIANPFASQRRGWPAVDGGTGTVVPTVLASFGNGFAVVVEPRISLGHSDAGTSATALLHRGYVRGVAHNIAIQVGRDEQTLGQSPFGAMFMSANAAPWPALTVGTDTAFDLPWLFRLAGPVRVTSFVGDLGAEQDPPHAKLAGWHVSVQPWRRFDLGVSVAVQTGGSGAPKATFFERFIDLFPLIDALAPQHADLQISNKVAGGNLRFRIPEWSGLDLYYELQIDDFDGRRLRSSLTEDTGHLLGARLPLIIAMGELTWRAEWHRNSLRLYEHGQFRSGMTYRERIIGNPLGPHAAAAYLATKWRPSPVTAFEVVLADEARDPSRYSSTSTGPRDRGFRLIRLTNDPDYHRRRATASVERATRIGALRVSAGYNRAWRTNQGGRDEWLGTIELASRALRSF